MSEEIIEDMLEEVAPQIAGDYPEIAQRYKAGEELTDEELDTIADVAISILRSTYKIGNFAIKKISV